MKGEHKELKLVVTSALGIAVAFVTIVLMRILREFTHAGLEGHKFRQFYSIFLPSAWILLVLVVFVGRNRPQINRVWFWALAGTFAGYIGGVISGTFIELFRPDGWTQMVLQSSHWNNWVTRLGYPFVSLNWLVGLVAGILTFAGTKIQRRDRPADPGR